MKPPINFKTKFWSAAFLMATSAIGPGFLTQTALFTQQLAASFGFVILVSLLIDLGVQLNIWKIITGYNKPAQEIVNELIPGSGIILSAMIVVGGLAFNIGNIAGAGLGLELITGMDNRVGSVLSALIAMGIMLSRSATRSMDSFVKWLGILMIGLTAYTAIAAKPPLPEALYRTVWPENIDWKSIVTIVGGTVGGYICFAGAHRLLELAPGEKNDPASVARAAAKGILTATIMRVLLFLGAFGVVARGQVPDPANPAASVFTLAAGNIGYRLFGIVMWSAAITSVVGSAFTSVSFISSYAPFLEKNRRALIGLFILVSTLVFLLVGKPVAILVWAGTINGFILPLSLSGLLLACWIRPAPSYQHPKWLAISGAVIALGLAFVAILVLAGK